VISWKPEGLWTILPENLLPLFYRILSSGK
jgi:hypothetical protein